MKGILEDCVECIKLNAEYEWVERREQLKSNPCSLQLEKAGAEQ